MPATEEAMVSALAPGKLAYTAIVGKSTLGSAETDSRRKPNMPKAMIDAVSNVVMTGRRMQSSDSPMALRSCLASPYLDGRAVRQQELSVSHDCLASGQALGDHRAAFGGAAHGDRLGHGLALLDEVNEVAALTALDRDGGHGDGVLVTDDQLG